MKPLLVILSALAVGIAGMAAGLSSCQREQGDHVGARRYALWTGGLLVVAVVLAVAAWRVR